ncbi:MAG: hypothetical protein IKC89_00590 [Lentisphaeria bacterium]|nr:hypothetical protein [Lentisphaeria bacterium]
MRKIFICLCLFSATVLTAALPGNSLVIEAESLKCDGKSWFVRPHFTGWYRGYPSGGNHLAGYTRQQQPATGKFKISHAGKYRFWVRYIDLTGRFQKNNGFVITLKQNGKVLAQKNFSKESLRNTESGQKKWGKGFGIFVWDSVDFAAAAGDVELELTKAAPTSTTGSGGRHLDMFIVTEDLNYEPKLSDLYTIFIRVRMLKEQKTPVAIHVFGRHGSKLRNRWYLPHLNINKQGVFKGANRGAGDMIKDHMKAGEVSPWIEISQYLNVHSYDYITFSAITSYHKTPPGEAAFEIQFSRTPSERGLWKSFRRSGSGNSMQLAIDLLNNRIVSDIEGSRASLDYAKKAGEVAGKYPENFPFSTGCALPPDTQKEVLDNEITALKSIGINSSKHLISQKPFKFASARGGFFHLRDNNCMQMPRRAAIDKRMKYYAEVLKNGNKAHSILLMDEPGLLFEHITDCAYCKSCFPEYLKKQGVTLAGTPSRDKKDALRYWWSCRYYQHIMTEFLRVGSDASLKYMPHLPTTVNFSTELLGGNMIERSCNWFDIYNSGALTYGWGEDWANTTRTYQSNGYLFSVLRAACRKRKLGFGMINVLVERPEWVIQSKAFLSIAHGAKSITFFNYGPWYVNTSDAQSHRPEVYKAIKKVTFTVGAIDRNLMDTTPVRGDAAQLWSEASDVWNMFEDNPFGKERIYLNLLLRHCQYRIDTVSVYDLDTVLNNYKLLFVSDSHLERKYAPAIEAWVKKGGTLFLTAGALRYDELNRPLGLLEKLGVHNDKLTLSQKSGRASFDMTRLKPLVAYKGMPLTVGIQNPLIRNRKSGKGTVISLGFFPGISYIGQGKPIPGAPRSLLNFPEAHRNYIKTAKLPVKPRISSDNYLIETGLLEGKTADVIVLSNWSGKQVKTELTIAGVPAYRKLNASGVKLLKFRRENGKLILTLSVPAGGCIECIKQ